MKTVLRSILKLSTMAFVVLLMIQSGGCSVVGLVVGGVQDAHKPGFGTIEPDRLSSVDTSHVVQAILKDNAVINGRFKGVTSHFGREYESIYANARGLISVLPPLGVRITVVDDSSRSFSGNLAGFEARRVGVDRRKKASKPDSNAILFLTNKGYHGYQTHDLAGLTEFTVEGEVPISIPGLRAGILNASLPSPATLVLSESMWQEPVVGWLNRTYRHRGVSTSYIPTTHIREIRYPHTRKGEKYFLYGLAIDAAIGAAVLMVIGGSLSDGIM